MRIAIIGAGISGLGAAFLLQQKHHICLFEKDGRIGGHARTKDVEGTPVDTGFIVFNKPNYPHLSGLFNHLKVPYEPSNMSFGASVANGWLEYGTEPLSALWAQPKNWLNVAHWAMIRDILKFNRMAPRYLDDPRNLTLGEVIRELKLGKRFRDHYLLAMGAAIWSTPPQKMLQFPATTLIRFFKNHGLLDHQEHIQWYTVSGGSRTYVERLVEPFRERIRLDSPVMSVSRDEQGVIITTRDGEQVFDAVVFACHSDQALKLLAQPTPEETRYLGAVGYQPNDVVLHSDTALMPKNRRCWQSWVFLSSSKNRSNARVSLSYWMNKLQNLTSELPLLVTLNSDHQADPHLTHDQWRTQHPLFDQPAIDAQAKLASIQGKNHTYYCGAWLRYGFHEDGLASAVDVAAQLGCEPPWQRASTATSVERIH